MVYGAVVVGVVLGAMCLITAFGGRWLVWWHGEGQSWQYQFYRCPACRSIVTHRQILMGGCPCHESSKISPAKLTMTEKIRLLYLPWTMTTLWEVRQSRPSEQRAREAQEHQNFLADAAEAARKAKDEAQ